MAQNKENRYKGSFLGGQKNWNIFKSKKKYKHIKNKKGRKQNSFKKEIVASFCACGTLDINNFPKYSSRQTRPL